MVIHFSLNAEVNEISKAEQAKGKLQMQFGEDKLMRSVLEADKQTIDEGKLVAESFNHNIRAFVPSSIFQNLVKNFSLAKKLYGETILRMISGYDPNYIKKNLGIPEFQKELKKRIEQKIEGLKDKDILGHDGEVKHKGLELASLVLYTEELNHLMPKGVLGYRALKEKSHYGEKTSIKPYNKERYKDIAIKASVRTAIKRQHKILEKEDLKASTRQSKGAISVIYGLDASASMKGKKLETSKKAGIALAYKAINEKDEVGLVVFGSEVKDFLRPTTDFGLLLHKITQIRASRQTNLAGMMAKATELFPRGQGTKHLIILTDALPTTGKMPEKETLAAASTAKSLGITISVVGIQLDKQGAELAKKITKIGGGRLYVIKNLEELDRLVLQDYYAIPR